MLCGDSKRQGQPRLRLWARGVGWFAVALLLVDVLAVALVVYDLVCLPYGPVVLTLAFLSPCMLGVLVSLTLLLVGRRSQSGALRVAAAAVSLAVALWLVPMGVGVVDMRLLYWRREKYPCESTEELLRIACQEKDGHAIDVIARREDPAAVPDLAEILLDENELGRIRVVAAQALGRIGGPEAREALERVRDSNPEDYLATAVKYALEAMDHRDARQSAPQRETP